jgi:uncharacterized RDD family membrane protein YckC
MLSALSDSSKLPSEIYPRAGFWRRASALLLDGLIIGTVMAVPLQIIVSVLYQSTNGRIQSNSGAVYTLCSPVSIPGGLNPEPMKNATGVTECRAYFLAWETARTLTVFREVGSANVQKTEWIGPFQFWKTTSSGVLQSYTLGPDGHQVAAVSYDWIVWILGLAYLVIAEWWFGQTLGKRALGLVVRATPLSTTNGIPLHRALIRQLAPYLGLLPLWFWPLHIAAALFAAAWIGLIALEAARKRDPIHDSLAGTHVFYVLGPPAVGPWGTRPL